MKMNNELEPPVLPPIEAAEPEVQGPRTVMGALKHQTELIKSLENSLYISLRPLMNGRFVLPALPKPLTEADDSDESIDPEAALIIIRQQTEAIASLQKSVAKMRPMISNLVAANTTTSPTRRGGASVAGSSSVPASNHTTIKYRTQIQRGGSINDINNTPTQPTGVRPKNFAEACSSYLTRARQSASKGGSQTFVLPLPPNEEGVETTDEEIGAIIQARKDKNQWPVKRNTYKCFTKEEELVKVRFHRSQTYPHLPIRIPITESNKEGRLNCRLCSESQGNSRSTSWMCSVCEIPLCIQIMDGDETNDETHHVKFHTINDLIAEHKVCNAKLSNVRGARKERKQNLPKFSGEVEDDGGFDPSTVVVEPTPVGDMNLNICASDSEQV
mmetsp:Transcript_19209/g.31474  ORF Transcript_19209/g.31474 Transcript_19209/m.31474 type:complete len:387 (-) Transcript_19209:135-1295(-)